MKRLLGTTVATGLLTASVNASALDFDGWWSNSNDFGNVGLLQTPTARMRPDGDFGFGVGTVKPYNQAHFFLQLTPWLESSIRYTSVTNRSYGPEGIGTDHYKDRSIDFKVRLLDEGIYHPAIALGAQDIGGTGLFSSEYLVSSYHYYDLDFSAGLAWGRLGSRGNIPNPFSVFGGDYNRPRALTSNEGDGQAGSVDISRLFSGNKIGPFGGVQWKTPIRNLMLKIEYDGNNYQEEGLFNRFKVSSPINVGLVYQPYKGVELGLGYERGDTLSANVNFALNLQQFRGISKVADPSKSAVRAVSAHAEDTNAIERSGTLDTLEGDWVLRLRSDLERQHIVLSGLSYREQTSELIVWFQQNQYRIAANSIGRVARAVSATAPASVKSFTVVNQYAGVETFRVTIPREEFENVANHIAPREELDDKVIISAPQSDDSLESADLINDSRYPAFNWNMGPALRQNIGGPDGFLLAQLWWRINGDLALSDHFSLSGTLGLNIVNNFGDLKQTSNSVLPHVRSDIDEYLKNGQNNIVKLEGNYIWSPYSNIYSRLSAGIFEEMFGGVAAEVLWRPYGRPWAVGVDVNHVYQREYDELLTFRDYNVTTGFIDFYYQLPFYKILATVSAGQYLAGDRGATLDLSREFESGVIAGIFATRTNVSAARFGEGSFDKGVYISIPLDLFSARSSRAYGTALFRPLTRDGGQRATDGKSLYSITRDSDPLSITSRWSELSQ